jgi:hypothetical protein
LGASTGQLASPLERAFAAACAAIFDAPLLSHGFSRGTARLEPAFCTQDYCAGTRYIAVSVSADPRDPPFYAIVVLGDGSVDWPDRDWNSIALWRLARDRCAGDEVSPGNYPLSDSAESQSIPSDLGPLFTRMRDHLVSFAADFPPVLRPIYRVGRTADNPILCCIRIARSAWISHRAGACGPTAGAPLHDLAQLRNCVDLVVSAPWAIHRVRCHHSWVRCCRGLACAEAVGRLR